MRSNTVIPAPVARVERGIGTRPGPTASFKKEMLSVRSLNAKALHSVEPSVGNFVVGAVSWSRLSEQIIRFDKWNLCRG